MIGNIFFVWISNKCNVNSKSLLVIHLCINCLLPLWALLGMIPDSPVGLVNAVELYIVVGLFYGSQLGSLFSTSRSLYGHLIPIGHESKFFGLYELVYNLFFVTLDRLSKFPFIYRLTNKGSSWIGPLLASFIANAYSLRWALVYVFTFYLIAVPLLQCGVNYDEGLKQAGRIDFDTVDDDDVEESNGGSQLSHDGKENVEIAPLVKVKTVELL